MHPSRRDFLQALVASTACASLPPLARGESSRLADDPIRPQFHLLPAKNWMNDPNGPIYWHGRYHMFFQYNPNAAVWGDMHWNHAVSDDMIHWGHLPIALAPTPGWDDADGCFTGSAVDDQGTATILYTGVKSVTPDRATLHDGTHTFREVQCLATSSDPQLRTWRKWKTPVIEPPQDPVLTGFRDPFLWRDGATWYLGVGSGLRKQGGNVLLYRSKDLRNWEYLHPLASGQWTGRDSVNPVDSGEMWECPDFFSLGSKHVLLYSTAGKVIWETGQLDPKEFMFHSERRGILDHGAYYAQKTQLDVHGNRILWGWIPETRPEAEFSAAGWAGCMALPRVLSLNADGDLEMHFAPPTESLRGKAFAGHKPKIENLTGEFSWKMAARGPAATPNDFALADGSSPWFSLSLESAGKTPKLTVNGKSINLPASAKSDREFHLFLDASVAELICDDLHAITIRIYRKPNGPLHIVDLASGLSGVTDFRAWQLRPISSDRLTT
jgi:beta-fructofuranosidase